VVYHFGFTHLANAPQWLSAWLAPIASHGRESVSLFFVLSGFILAYVYLDNGNNPHIDAKSFWTARLARTYPVYLFSTLLAAAIPLYQLVQSTSTPTVLDHTTRVAALMLPMLQAWIPWAENWNFPSWALSAEMFFYLVFPFVGVLFARLKRHHLLIALVILYVLGRAAPSAQAWIGTAFGPGGLGLIPQGEAWRLDANPLLNLPTFLIGICLGRLFLERITKSVEESTPNQVLGWIISLIGAFATLAALAGFTFGLPADALYIPAFGLLVYGLAFGRGPLVWALSLPVILLLGEASYAIYILQYPVWQWLLALNQMFNLADPASGLFFAFYAIVLVLFSIGTLYAIERPARRIIRRLSSSGSHVKPSNARVLIDQ
jgi:peptidoglycan/LPS O-acetylase OafA/YrhL